MNGLRGIYIASQLKENATSSQISPADVVTVISFDKGAEWKLLQPPKFDDEGQSIDCPRSLGCSLHLGQRLSQLYAINRTAPVLTSASAIGLIVATGVVGTSMKGLPLIILYGHQLIVEQSLLLFFYSFTWFDIVSWLINDRKKNSSSVIIVQSNLIVIVFQLWYGWINR